MLVHAGGHHRTQPVDPSPHDPWFVQRGGLAIAHVMDRKAVAKSARSPTACEADFASNISKGCANSGGTVWGQLEPTLPDRPFARCCPRGRRSGRRARAFASAGLAHP